MTRMEASSYLDRHRARYRLTERTVIDAPIEDVFAFFSRAENLGAITPPGMGFVITESPRRMEEGAIIAYRVRLAGLAVRWRSCIERWRPGESFVDAQLSGPYHCWWHEHEFTRDGDRRTIMHDRVLYTPPLGIFGRLANRLFIANKLRSIFAYRSDAIRLRFGATKAREPATRS
jgi:ligand-binding SRPBCC domain-containing protein